MPTPRIEHAFQYAAAAAANGQPFFNAAGLRNGAFQQTGTTGRNSDQYPQKFMFRIAVVDTVAGGSVTFIVEEASFPGTSWGAPATFRGTTGVNQFTLTIPSGQLMKTHHFNHYARLPCVRIRTASYVQGSAILAYAYGSIGFQNV